MKTSNFEYLKEKAKNELSGETLPEGKVELCWTRGWHDCKEELVQRLIDSNMVVIDSDKLEELKENTKYPCKGCPKENLKLKIGCSIGKRSCLDWQKYCWYRDLYDWFINREIPEPI